MAYCPDKGECQEPVESHLYRVIDYTNCRCKARWKVGFRKYDGSIYYKELCTRHKNEHVKYDYDKRIVSVEPISVTK